MMLDDVPSLGFEPTSAHAEVSIDDLAVFSDDTGFFSGEDLCNSEDVEEDEQLDQLDHSWLNYFFTKNFLKLDEGVLFQVNFDKLIELIFKVAHMRDLVTGAKLLDVAMVIFRRQTDLADRSVQDLAFATCRFNRRNQNSRSEPETKTTTAAAIAENFGRSRYLSSRLANAESQIIINFDDIPIDAKVRKLNLRKKFDGLVSNVLMDFQFDIHSIYLSEFAVDLQTNERSINQPMLFTHLKRILAQEKTDSIIHFYNYEDDLEGGCDSLSFEDCRRACDLNEVTDPNSLQNENEGIAGSCEIDLGEENENQSPVGLNVSVENVVPSVEGRKKRKLRDGKFPDKQNKKRKPLEALNQADPEMIRLLEDGNVTGYYFEASITANDQHSFSLGAPDRDLENGISLGYPALECSAVEVPPLNIDCSSVYNQDGCESIRVPSPIFEKECKLS
ncbi:unnamed protein product [Orchesella dallaii]|uniref:Condensin complex subunit 2 n=1 Tax=Orchesella dallaii TaxID=48710 RepID=A0ABP1S647_9HEXA